MLWTMFSFASRFLFIPTGHLYMMNAEALS